MRAAAMMRLFLIPPSKYKILTTYSVRKPPHPVTAQVPEAETSAAAPLTTFGSAPPVEKSFHTLMRPAVYLINQVQESVLKLTSN